MMLNPALGSVLIWRFAHAYCITSKKNEIIMPLCFLPLPMIWHARTLEHIRSTQLNSGLRRFASKFSDKAPSELDLLLDLNRRAILLRKKTLESIRMALSTGLVNLSANGHLMPIEKQWPIQDYNDTTRQMCNAAEKVGSWFAPLTLREICLSIHVNF